MSFCFNASIKNPLKTNTLPIILKNSRRFNEGLGLDSIDALELGVALKKKFGIKFATEGEDTKKIFASVDSLAQYIAAGRAKAN